MRLQALHALTGGHKLVEGTSRHPPAPHGMVSSERPLTR